MYAIRDNANRKANRVSSRATAPALIAARLAFFDGACQMKRIPLTQGKYVLVDDEDFKMLNEHTWGLYTVRSKYHYAIRMRNGKRLRMHRVILGTPEGMFTDHINGNGLDNRKCNLRICTISQNAANARIRKAGTSKYKGVSLSRISKRWLGHIGFHSKAIHIGYFATEIEAAKAYDKKAIELFGEYARTNFRLGGKNGIPLG